MPASRQSKAIPTISRVCSDQTLVELVYDAEQRKTGLVVSRFGGLWNIEQEVTIETGEVLVPYAATNNLIASECVLLASKPEECGLKEDLLGDIRAFLRRYVDITPLFEDVAAHYVLLTWVYDRFGEMPYLRLRGDFGSGKTRGLLALGSICYRPFFASAASTTAPIFHTINAFGGTLVLDEADLPFSDERAEVVKILNSGSVRGMPLLRCVPNKHREFNPHAFKVFGPKIVGMREAFSDHALESRFITEEMGQRPLRPDIPIHLPPAFKQEALTLRNRLLHYRISEYFNISSNPAALISGVAPRLNQTALSLLSLVDDPAVRARIQDHLAAGYADLVADREASPEAAVLAAALAALEKADGAGVPLRRIAEQYNMTATSDFGWPASNRWIGSMLRKKLHIRTRKSNGIYIVPMEEQEKLLQIAERYGISRDAA